MQTTMHLQLLSPSYGAILKRRTAETVLVRVGVAGDEQELVVEVWGAIHDNRGKRQAATPLKCVGRQGELSVYEVELRFSYTGFFPIAIRARKHDQQYWDWLTHEGQGTLFSVWVDPAWIYDSIVYNAFVRYFGAKTIEADGEIKPIKPGTFDDVKQELKKLHNMGINVLYLNPVHMIGELYKNYNPHDLLPEYLQPGCPYSVKDYKSIDPELNFTEKQTPTADHPFAEFKKLVDEAHKLGIRVFMDLVFNHCAHDAVFQRIHPEWFLYKQNIYDLHEPYIYPEEIKQGKPWGDPKHTFSPYDHGWWWQDAAQLNWNNCDKYPEHVMPNVSANPPPLNPTINEMYAYFKSIVKFWIREFGIDGFRCDVAYRVPLDFWQSCIIEARQVAKDSYPKNGSIDGDVVFIAETYTLYLRELLEAGFTACYGDFGNKLHSLPQITGYVDYMYNISGNHFPDKPFWFIFPECHDFHRVPERMAKHLRDEHKDADLNANKSRWTLTACLPGMPMIYNGFEKIEWHKADLFSYSAIDWESDKDISDHIEKVNRIRRNEMCLRKGEYYYLHTSEGITDQSKIYSYARIHENECMIIIVNIDIVNAAQGVTVHLPNELPIDFTKPFVLDDLLNNKKYERKGNQLSIILEPGEAHIFKVKQ
jgi:alpha-amylase